MDLNVSFNGGISELMLRNWNLTLLELGRGSFLPLLVHPRFVSKIMRRAHDLGKTCFSGALQYFETMLVSMAECNVCRSFDQLKILSFHSLFSKHYGSRFIRKAAQ